MSVKEHSPAQLAHYEKLARLRAEKKMQKEQEMAATTAIGDVVEVDPASPDPTDLGYVGMGMDQWRGATIEPGWHHVLVAEHQVGSGLPSNKIKFLRMGYQVAPCPPEIRAEWDEAKVWTMRIPQSVRDARVAASRAASKAQRDARSDNVDAGLGIQVTRNESKKTSLADLGLANG